MVFNGKPDLGPIEHSKEGNRAYQRAKDRQEAASAQIRDLIGMKWIIPMALREGWYSSYEAVFRADFEEVLYLANLKLASEPT